MYYCQAFLLRGTYILLNLISDYQLDCRIKKKKNPRLYFLQKLPLSKNNFQQVTKLEFQLNSNLILLFQSYALLENYL